MIVTPAATMTFHDFIRMVRAMPPAARNLLSAALDAVADEDEASRPSGDTQCPEFLPGLRCGIRCEICHHSHCNRGDPGHTSFLQALPQSSESCQGPLVSRGFERGPFKFL